MLLDANLLLYAVHKGVPQHDDAASWLTAQLNGPRRVGLPWQSLGAFLRISTHPRAFPRPLAPAVAWERVSDWLAAPVSWIPLTRACPDPRRAHHHLRDPRQSRPRRPAGRTAIEHGLTLCSTDTDFARFQHTCAG